MGVVSGVLKVSDAHFLRAMFCIADRYYVAFHHPPPKPVGIIPAGFFLLTASAGIVSSFVTRGTWLAG